MAKARWEAVWSSIGSSALIRLYRRDDDWLVEVVGDKPVINALCRDAARAARVIAQYSVLLGPLGEESIWRSRHAPVSNDTPQGPLLRVVLVDSRLPRGS
jgi:hypothetical protein